MVDFRRVITALAVLALFTGLAMAQVGGSGQTQLTCNTNVTVTPALRGEGFTENTGDITITCTGGAPPSSAAGANSVPLVNFSVFYNTIVTSRLLPITANAGSVVGATNTSEALLIIDEPGTAVSAANPNGLTGFGPTLPQVLCTTPLTGCAAFVGFPVGPGGVPSGVIGAVTTSGGSIPAPNVYQGVVNGNSVTFFGVPVLAPTTTGSRVFRITNVRVNAQPLAGGSASGASPVQASISTSGGFSISNSAPNVGFVSTSLSASASGASNRNQCSSVTKASINTLTFSESGAFATAFKTRVTALTNTSYAGQATNVNGTVSLQNTPGGIFNSESNFIFPIPGNVNQTAGLADFGTRLKATFNNIPTGVRIFVSTTNVNNDAFPVTAPPVGSTATVGGVIGGSTGNGSVATTAYVGFAQLVSSETTADGNVSASTGFFPQVTATDNGPIGGNVPIAEIPIDPTSHSGTAVWEVVNTNPFTVESFKFSVYTTFVSSVATNTPLPGTSTVSLSYAPTAASGAASSTLPIPRFATAATPANILVVQICRTILLYPYVTGQAGFDTGVAIANTSVDPLNLKPDGTTGFQGTSATNAQTGNCKLYWFGGTTAAPTTPPAASDTGTIAAGAVYVNTVRALVNDFQGYMFAVCNFQYAHGFAFVSDVGARNLAMGYLALVIPDPGTGGRSANPIGGSLTSSGEQDAH